MAAFVAVFVLLFLGVGTFLTTYLLEPDTPQREELLPPPPPPEPPGPLSPNLSKEYLYPDLAQIPPRPLPDKLPDDPSPEPDDDITPLDIIDPLLPWLGVPFALAWFLWIWLRRRYVLRRAPDDDGDQGPLTALSIHSDNRPLFDSSLLRDALRRLHQPIEIPSRRLHVPATIAATIEQAGFFRPISRGRRFVPELLLLIGTRDPRDLMTGLGKLTAQRLRQYGHEVFVYYYRGAPDIFTDSKSQETLNPEALFQRHPHARLLLIGDPAALLTNLGTGLTIEADSLTRWSRRGVLITRAAHPVRSGVLATRGFYVEPLTDEGIRLISIQLTELPQPAVTRQSWPSPPPPFQERHSLLWWQRPPRRQFKPKLAALRDYLGEDGYWLLGAMAVYPALDWGLTQALDSRLFPDAGPDGGSSRREQRLIRISQLSWSRMGWLPEWFRLYLLRHLGRKERRDIRQQFRLLLRARDKGGDATIRLPIRIAQSPGWRDYLEGRIAKAAQRSDLKDAIFANLVLGGKLGLWDFTLPRWIGHRLPAGNWSMLLPPFLKASLLVVLFGLFASVLWQGMPPYWDWNLRHEIQARFFEPETTHEERREQPFAIVHDNNPKLAGALAGSLQKLGFVVVELTPEVQKKLTQTVTQGILSGANADPNAAEKIAARLAWLTYRRPAKISITASERVPSDTIVVRLANVGPDPAVFAKDSLDKKLRDEKQGIFTDGDKLRGVIDEFYKPDVEPEPQSVPAQKFRKFRDTLKSGEQGPEMLVIPAGEFMMGSPEDEKNRDSDEGPQRRVRIQPFALGVTEVTFEEYDRFAKATKRKLPDDKGWGRGKRPVINVSWHDATEYAQWLSEQTGEKYRLPTEAEWEYAARAGTETPFSTGECITTDQANYNGDYDYAGCGAKTGVDRKKTVPAGSLPANPWGLQEVHGNVWEWTADCWHGDYKDAPTDGGAWGEENNGYCRGRMVRGGAWSNKPRYIRSANRNDRSTNEANFYTGFRLARDI
uniref:Formylglycine-generating enzyme, required for sulfatase activity, contains SUMF1/FGE domain n=1 Tax=Candidatus Kentrum sp. TUN TaxID=2126343 RepID=A0A450ZT76_9GAMM|nr:MAG: Formylglycine-generating enzyme, required for sulfatase activity, contains SUMF1/FGE domain [Candidatus Kentron sp. TUN]